MGESVSNGTLWDTRQPPRCNIALPSMGALLGDLIYPLIRGIKIVNITKKSEPKESSVVGDSSKDFMKGSSQGECQYLEAPQGAIGQNLCLQGVGEAPISWEHHLSPSSLRSENLEVLTEKVGTLGHKGVRRNHCGAAKRWARKAKMDEALVGD